MSNIIRDFEKFKDSTLPGIFDTGHDEASRAHRWAQEIVESKRIDLVAPSDSNADEPMDEFDRHYATRDQLAHEQYALSQCMPQIEQFTGEELPKILGNFARTGMNDKYNPEDYEIAAFGSKKSLLGVVSAFDTIEKTVGQKQYGFGAETPTGFCLEYAGAPVAVVAFGSRLGRIAVEQIQGIKPTEDRLSDGKESNKRSTLGLDWHDWRGLMVELAGYTARCVGAGVVTVESAHKNRWTRIKYSDGTPHLPLERAIKVYDGTAKRLGFELGRDGDWHKKFA